jgi:glycosyltransferase involved in cell wall biosynthesis
MSREMQSYAEQCFVHSRFARDVLNLDRGTVTPDVPVSLLPLGIRRTTAVSRGALTRRPLIITLGAIDESNGLASLIAAFGLVAAKMPEARLVIADSGESNELERWRRYAAERAADAKIEFHESSSREYRTELLATADLAVQLHRDDGAESSGNVSDCLSHGVPAVVTELGWPGELPDGTVVKVALDVEPARLSQELQRLLADSGERRSLSEAALAHAADSSFARVADVYFEALELA